jgi:hypothetical protein
MGDGWKRVSGGNTFTINQLSAKAVHFSYLAPDGGMRPLHFIEHDEDKDSASSARFLPNGQN